MSDGKNNQWAEPLPSSCPPEAAAAPDGDFYYRLADAFPTKESDFFSQRRLFPKKAFAHGDECHARAVSIFNCPIQCEKMAKLPLLRQKRCIVMLELTPESGVVEQWGGRKEHFSWWMSKGFDPSQYSQKYKLLDGS